MARRQRQMCIRDSDYLVATDAIGMGLNLDVNHVAFSSISKFDGRTMRFLAPNELAQIAGRAGRGMSDGSFGETGEVGSLDENVVQAIVEHRFKPLKKLMWRNSDLSFATIDSLIKSLDKATECSVLVKAREAEDFIACLLYTSPSPRDIRRSRMPSSA